nr:hypothetical protein [Anaerolineae bacterium]
MDTTFHHLAHRGTGPSVAAAVLFRHRLGEKHAQRLTALYGGLVAVWGLSGALTALAEVAPAVTEPAGLIINGLAPAIVGLLVVLEHAFIEQGGGRLWGIVGSERLITPTFSWCTQKRVPTPAAVVGRPHAENGAEQKERQWKMEGN